MAEWMNTKFVSSSKKIRKRKKFTSTISSELIHLGLWVTLDINIIAEFSSLIKWWTISWPEIFK